MVEREDTESKIKQLVEEFVQENWSNTQTVCYLSSIGIYLNRTAPDSRQFLSRGLREFLRQNHVVQVVQYPGVEQKIGAVPLSVPLPDDVTELFSSNKSTLGLRSRNVYLRDFWEAFVRPIEGAPRHILIDEANGIAVLDGSVNDDTSRAYEVLKEDVTPSLPDGSIAEKVSATHLAIETWLNKHSLKPELFVRPKVRRAAVTTGSRLEKLLSAFDGLPSDDLARVNVPLDILVKLISKK